MLDTESCAPWATSPVSESICIGVDARNHMGSSFVVGLHFIVRVSSWTRELVAWRSDQDTHDVDLDRSVSSI